MKTLCFVLALLAICTIFFGGPHLTDICHIFSVFRANFPNTDVSGTPFHIQVNRGMGV